MKQRKNQFIHTPIRRNRRKRGRVNDMVGGLVGVAVGVTAIKAISNLK